MAKKFLAKKSENISDWYQDVILKAELADYAPVKGCMVIRPYGYSLWEGIQKYMDPMIKSRGVQNAYFPLFIPESYLQREKDHVEGFAPEVAVVTIAGNEELKEKLIVRPTSETIMYEMYKQWTQSYRDLPILINQWNNVVRWEKRTYLFLRTSEFLWQEGHCAHETHGESESLVRWALDIYTDTYRSLMSLYGIPGIKSESEKFAGALRTYTYEMLMPDGKALQACTSHDLGQNFAKSFDWTVLGRDQDKIYPWQNSWGFSTRSIGGLIMAHGDDEGLVLPPRIAPIQAVVIPVPGSSEALEMVDNEMTEWMAACRWEVDTKEDESLGFKQNKWEVKGVPLRIIVGTKEVEGKFVTVIRRDNGEKMEVKLGDLRKAVTDLLVEIDEELLAKHKKFTEDNTRVVNSYDEFKKIMEGPRGFIKALWCEDRECETKIKAETKASTRCLPLDSQEEKGVCIYCGKEAKNRWLFAQAY